HPHAHPFPTRRSSDLPARWANRRRRPPVEPPAQRESNSKEIEFIGYAEDCTLSGRLDLAGDRLSDVMNATDHLLLLNVLVTDLRSEEHTSELQSQSNL